MRPRTDDVASECSARVPLRARYTRRTGLSIAPSRSFLIPMPLPNLAAPVGVVTSNSTEYVRAVLRSTAVGRVVVPLRAPDDTARLEAFGVQEVIEPGAAMGWCRIEHVPLWSDDIAQVSFTSGTESAAKGVLLSHRNLADTVQRLNDVMRVDASIREYVGVPVYHSFGFGRCRAVSAAGGEFYLPEGGFNPLEIRNMLIKGEINAVSAVPSLWRILLKNSSIFGDERKRLRWIEIGSQYMSRQEKEALRTLFSEAVIVQHYGLTEASRTTFLQVHVEQGEALESVGRCVGGTEVKIGDDGRIMIRGPHVAAHYVVDGALRPITDDDGWLRTSDLGTLQDGLLMYGGRADDIINCSGIKINPDGIEEQVLRTLGLGAGIAVARVPHPVRGEGVLIAKKPEVSATDAQITSAAAQALRSLGVSGSDAITVWQTAEFPVTPSGKVQRKKLTQAFLEAAPALATPPSPAPEPAVAPIDAESAEGMPVDALAALLAEWRKILGVQQIDRRANFIELGGDSLSFIEASMAVEKIIGWLPDDWESLPLQDLAAKRRVERRRFSLMSTPILVRAIAIIFVAMTTLEVYDVHGTTNALFVLAGWSFAKYQLRSILQTGRVSAVLSTVFTVAIPAVLVSLFIQRNHLPIHWDAVFLLSNFTVPQINKGEFWFVNVLLQCLLLLALFFWFKPARALAARNPFGFAAWGTVFTGVVALFGTLYFSPDRLLGHLPHIKMWLIFLGMAIAYTETQRQRLFVTVGALLSCFYYKELEWFPVVSTLAVIYVPRIKVPALMAPVISLIASASLFIYLVDLTSLSISTRVPFLNNAVGQVVTALASGVAVYKFWKFVQDKFAQAQSRWGAMRSSTAASRSGD